MSVKSTQGFNDFPVPVGSVIAYAGGINAGRMPMNYLVCDGTSYQETEFPELFSVIGTNFGSIGAGVFNVPNMNGFVPKCANVAGVISVTPSSTATGFDPITLTASNIPPITGINIGANINGNFPTGSSASSTAKTDTNSLGNDKPMTSWNTTSTVDMTSVTPPVFNYNNGSGSVAPVNLILAGDTDFVIPNVEMVFLIKTKNHFFPNPN